MTPALLPEFYCQPAVGTGGGGSPCALDSSCASGTCLFAGVSGLVQPYCRDVCASAADCAVGFDCRLFGVWHANTPADPDDDAALPICVRGGVDETCPLVGPNICDEGLVCVPKLPSQDFGACGSPDPP